MKRTCETCAYEGSYWDRDPCRECGDGEYWVPKTFERICDTCVHEDLNESEEPCCNCFGMDHWEPKPAVEIEPPKAPTCSSCEHYTGDIRDWPCCDYYSSDCWTPKPEPDAERRDLKLSLPTSEETEGRENVAPQPPPTPNSSTPIWDLVIEDMRARDLDGRRKYGTPLQAGNGRDALVDAYQEALDLVVYLRQAIEERDS